MAKVLIIDDDPGVLFLHELIVTETHLSVNPTTFTNAEDALNHLLPIDVNTSRILIFLDINMPKVSGWDFLEILKVKIQNADIKVVMVTSSLSVSERERSKEYKIVIDYWEKPMEDIQVNKLIEKLGGWLI
ncbi:MAG: response regulator [Flavobacteriales bacterium]|nr:response regulator [Flavobacteriales bacterium]MBS4042148.1 response regulator [Flavobacteriales bacterium]